MARSLRSLATYDRFTCFISSLPPLDVVNSLQIDQQVIGADAYVVEETRDRRLAELACADEERTLELTLQYKVYCVNAFRSQA